MRLGDLEFFNLTDGCFRLDGGAMFGVVPRALWERTDPPDPRNRILLNLGVLLVISGGKKILVDSGAGSKHEPKANDIYAIDHSPSLEASMGKVGVTRDEVDMVVNTHLHFDHAGGNTIRRTQGLVVPAFPNARYFVQRGEWDWARSDNERARASYLRDDFDPLEKSGCLVFLDGDEEVAPGVVARKTPGHTEHHQSVFLDSRGERAVFLGDLIPTASHISLPYVMGYDVQPLVTLETKRALLTRAVKENWILIFQHDPRITMARVRLRDGKFVVDPVSDSGGPIRKEAG